MQKSSFLILTLLLIFSCITEPDPPVVYTLTTQVTPADGGSVSPLAGEYEANATFELLAIPNEEYVFSGWSGGLSGASNPITLTMTSDISITAEFVKKRYPLTINIEGEGAVEESISGSQGEFETGTVVTLTAKPASGWVFKEWSGDVSGTSNPAEITVDEPKTVTATFIQATYALEVSIEGNGTYTETIVSGKKVDGNYEQGTILDLEAVPADGWEFVEWTGDLQGNSNPIQITIDTLKKVGILFRKSEFEYTIETLLTGYNTIWGFDFLADNSLIFTEKTGNMYIHKDGQTSMLNGFPTSDVNAASQGGLLDVAVPPNHEATGWIYTVYTKKDINASVGANLTMIRFKVSNSDITNIDNIFEIEETSTRNGHYGSRIAFTEDHLYLSVGEGSPSLGGANSPYQNGQNIDTYWGKIHRFNYGGSIPSDNPLFDGQQSPNSIFSMGHRNPQGLTIHPEDGSVWSSEHGPQGGDEINVILPGKNYGWPLVSYGVNYGGSDISGKSHQGYEEPLFYWDPSIATSNIDFVENKSSAWYGNLLVAGLKTQSIFRLEYANGQLSQVERIQLGSRVRNVKEHSDGSIYVSLESPGRIVVLTPK